MHATIERKEKSATATREVCFFEFIAKGKLSYDIKVILLLPLLQIILCRDMSLNKQEEEC
jgi:hypothetical protein